MADETEPREKENGELDIFVHIQCSQGIARSFTPHVFTVVYILIYPHESVSVISKECEKIFRHICMFLVK